MTLWGYITLFAAIAFPVAFYMKEAWRVGQVGSEKDGGSFFVAQREIQLSEYRVSTVAYGLQMAAIVLFAQWGYYYGYWALIVPFAWGLGFGLLWLVAPKFGGFFEITKTLHGFIAGHHGKSRLVACIAALATVLGLGGALFAELNYVASAITLSVESTGGNFLRYLLMGLFLFVALAYVLPGGFRAVVSTDKRQLPVSYIGIAALLASLVLLLTKIGQRGAIEGPLTIAFLSFAVIFIIYVWEAIRNPSSSCRGFWNCLVPAACIIILIIALVPKTVASSHYRPIS